MRIVFRVRVFNKWNIIISVFDSKYLEVQGIFFVIVLENRVYLGKIIDDCFYAMIFVRCKKLCRFGSHTSLYDNRQC